MTNNCAFSHIWKARCRHLQWIQNKTESSEIFLCRVESLNCRCWSCSSLLSPLHVLVTTLIHQPGLAVHHRAKKHPFFRRYLWMEAYDNNPSWKPDVVTQTDGRYWAVLMISQRHSRSVPFLDFLERNMKWCRYITFLLLIHFSILFKLSR